MTTNSGDRMWRGTDSGRQARGWSRSDAVLAGWVMLVTVVSAIHPVDYATWFFELFLGFIGVAVLLAWAPRFRLSGLVYLVVGVHYLILALGAHYTYAEMPLFDELANVFDWSRNHFDRLGHFAQGLTPALLLREILPRTSPLKKSLWIPTLAVSFALAFSALYEILEWVWVVTFYPDRGPEWLGMQGDPWDAQADMTMALLGALCAVTILAPWHERSIRTAGQGE